MEADKFSIHLGSVRIRAVTESPDLRPYLDDAGFEVHNTAGVEGLLLGRPAADREVGRPAWVLYESGSVVLRRSLRTGDVFEAAAYHLATLYQAAASDRLALHARVIVLPGGAVWLFDPYVLSELGGLDRRLARVGCTVLPTSIASVDPTSGEVVLPEREVGGQVRAGRYPIARMLYRTWPATQIEGVEALRLARSVVRHGRTDLQLVLRQIVELVTPGRGLFEMLPGDEIAREVEGLVTDTLAR